MTANFDTAAVGQDKSVAVAGLVLGGADAGNYVLPGTISSTGNVLQTLEVITDVIPVEVLQASAAAERAAQEEQLRAAATEAANAVDPVDYEAATAGLVSGLPPVVVNPVINTIPANYRDATLNAYVSAATAAQDAQANYNAQAQVLRGATREFKALTQDYNNAVRDAEVAQGLQTTLETEITAINTEIAKIEANLATAEAAAERIADLKKRILDATRLGRGNEVAELQAMIDEAEEVLATADENREALARLQDARAESEARLDDNAATIARANQLKAAYTAAEANIQKQKQSVTAAKTNAQTAIAALDEARAAGEERARAGLEIAQAAITRLTEESGPDVDAEVDRVLSQYEGGTNSNNRRVSDSFPLSEERQAEIAATQAEGDAAIRQYDSFVQQQEAAFAQIRTLPQAAKDAALRAIIPNGLGDKTSEELAQLDPRDLGISEDTLLPSSSESIFRLDRATAPLANQLAELGELRGLFGDRTPATIPATIANGGSRGMDNLDEPLTFDPMVEVNLKNELQATGLLPKFNDPVLAGLPVSQQLKLNSAMQQLASSMANASSDGGSDIKTMQEQVDEQTVKLITMALFDQVGKKNRFVSAAGDVPGVQDAVGAMIGELAAQYGISTEPLMDVMGGDISVLTGLPQASLNKVGEIAQDVVNDPVGAGVTLVSDTTKNIGNVALAGGEAFVKAWTGSGASSDAAERAAQEREAVQAFEARREKLSALTSTIVAIETRREEAVQERETNLAAVKTYLVAGAQEREADLGQARMGNRSILIEQRDAAVAEKRTELQREQIAEFLAPGMAQEAEAKAEQLARAQESLEVASTKLTVFGAEGGGE